MTTRRAARALLATAIVAIGVSLIPLDARALDGTEFNIPGRQKIEVDEPPIAGNDPASATAGAQPDPPTCSLSPSCMTVPFTIEVPERNEADDFVVYLEFSWDAPSGLEDIDFWIYDDGQTQEEAGSSGFTEVASSASGDNPEKVKLFEPLLGRYNIVANNFTGANAGWHIKAESTVGVFDRPIESLAPSGGTHNPNDKPTPTTLPRPTSTTLSSTTTVTVAAGNVFPDGDFQGDAFAPDNAFQDQLAAAQEASSALRSVKPDTSSPSALSVIAAMVGFPAVLVALVFVALRLRKGAFAKVRTHVS